MPDRRARSSIEEDGRIIEEIIGRHADKLPDGFKRIDFEFGEDSTGDPAVRVFLVTADDRAPTKEQAVAIDELADALRSEIIAARTDHWPYVGIRVEK